MKDKVLDYFIDPSKPIYQNRDHFCFNTDTKLLVQFAKVKKGERILDIGTNNGALLVGLDGKEAAELVGVEILYEPFLIAKTNQEKFINDPCKIVHSAIQDFDDDLFDVIVSNPPYFKKDATHPNMEQNLRQLGRVEENLTLEELVENAQRLLKSYGRFYLVHRPNRLNDIFKTLHAHSFQVKTLQTAYDKRTHSIKSILIEAIKEGNCDCSILPSIEI